MESDVDCGGRLGFDDALVLFDEVEFGLGDFELFKNMGTL